MPEPTSRMTSLQQLLATHTMPAADELVRAEDAGALRCQACGHRCLIKDGQAGVCQMRFNHSGELRVPHGYVAGLGVDPIEKKPFFHAFPGREALSFGMLGCNLHCPFCQNWSTSQTLRDERAIAEPSFVTAEQIVALAVENDCPVITSTYNEPAITAEWAVEVFRLGAQSGLMGSFVSNGHMTPEALEHLRPHANLLNIDLKAFEPETYRRLGGRLEAVLDTIRRARGLDFWVEIVTLIVPGLTDSDDELRQIAEFIAGVSTEIPWHVTAFRPTYKLSEPPRTPPETLERAHGLGRAAGLKFVYAGNLPGRVGELENTLCPDCGRTAIVRDGFRVTSNDLVAGCCPGCDTRIAGVWA